jgi:hypothetical protein
MERTLICDLKTEVNFVPRGADLRCKKMKSTFRKAKANEKLEKQAVLPLERA